MASQLAFIGLGNIGSRMAAHLIKAGHDVRVYDVNQSAVQAMVDLGATSASTPALAAKDAEAVFTSLPTPAIVTNVVTGTDGILEGLMPGAVIVEHSTIDPATVVKLATEVRAAGGALIDAPISGGVQGAEAATLAIMVGGEEADLTAVRPYLELYGAPEKITHIGPMGTGQVVKLANNMITAINIVALGEVLTTSVEAGLDLDVAVKVLSGSSANSNVLSNYFPRTLFTEERPVGFSLNFIHKDIALFLDSVSASEIPLPVTRIVQDIYAIARQQGLGNKDFTSVVEFYEQFSNVRLQTGANK